LSEDAAAMNRHARARWLGLATLTVGALGALAIALGGPTGCSFPDYEVATDGAPADARDGATVTTASDAGATDAVVDTLPNADATYALADGGTCSGHDEDGDGVPDLCDNCPNVANAGQEGGAVGTACTPPSDLLTNPVPGFFSPFVSYGTPSWQPFASGSAPWALAPAGDALLGGTTGDGDLRFVLSPFARSSNAVSIITVLHLVDDVAAAGSAAGLLVRATATPPEGCSGGSCAPSALANVTKEADGGLVAASLTIPPEIAHTHGAAIGLMMTISTGNAAGDAGVPLAGTVECRLFNPLHPETLTEADPTYFVRAHVARTQWSASGELGLFAQESRAQFDSLSVVRGD
jgi:hypothetical protein